LSELGARVIISELIIEKSQKAAQSIPGVRLWSKELGVIPGDFSLILDASTSESVFPEESLPLGACIAAPGMPFSFNFSPRYKLWSEPLATGTAVMLVKAAFT
ncbi:MAG: hypothetical protein LBS44_04735, partial [Deltaproteobacteria bacterium]|nr:hypothetical protein [Deltaproteobacteria bacterium]